MQQWLRILLAGRALRQRGSFSSREIRFGLMPGGGPGDAAEEIVSVAPMKREFQSCFNWYRQGGGEKD